MLVSSRLLRERRLGQIDLARLEKKEGKFLIHVAEVKSSQIGEEALLRGQRSRLMESLRFLSKIFGYEGKFSVLTNAD